MKGSSKVNEDLFQATDTISDKIFQEIFEESIGKIDDHLIIQEINQKKYILNNLEEFNNQMELILGEAKKESIFEFNITGISLIDRKKEERNKDEKKDKTTEL